MAILVVASQAVPFYPSVYSAALPFGYPQETPAVAAARKEHAVQWMKAKTAADTANYYNHGIVPKEIAVEAYPVAVVPGMEAEPRTFLAIPAFVAGLVVGAVVG